MGKKCNRNDLSEMFGVNNQTITNWVTKGCPFIEKGAKGKEWLFDSADVAKWREDDVVSRAIGDTKGTGEDELKIRKLAAETTIQEVAAAKARRDVADIEEVERTLANIFAVFRSRVRRIPERSVMRIIGDTDEARIKSVLLDEIDGCLNLLSEDKFLIDMEDE